jgi:hypothetical protein
MLTRDAVVSMIYLILMFGALTLAIAVLFNRDVTEREIISVLVAILVMTVIGFFIL